MTLLCCGIGKYDYFPLIENLARFLWLRQIPFVFTRAYRFGMYFTEKQRGSSASAAEAVSAETAYDSKDLSVTVSSDSAVRDTNVGYICITVGAFEDNFGNYIYRFQYINKNDSEAMSKYYVE